MPIRHYAFLSFGRWGINPAHIRARQLGAEMLRRGIKITYLVDDYPENHAGLGIAAGAEVAFVPAPRGIGQLPGRRKILRKLRPDFLHIKDPNFRTFAALVKSSHTRVVLDWDEPYFLKEMPWKQHQLEVLYANWTALRADKIVVTTHYLQHLVKQKWHRDSLYLPFGLYLPPFADGPNPYEKPNAVYMGSMHPLWDIDLMMDAVRLLAEAGDKPAFTFVGGNQAMWQDYVNQHKLDNVNLLGYQPEENMWQYLRHAHVLLFPIRDTPGNQSRCPSKTLAYAQVRRPVITSRIGAVGDMLGDEGLYVQPTAQAMADAIRDVMRKPMLPDIDYHIERFNYPDLVDQLLGYIDS